MGLQVNLVSEISNPGFATAFEIDGSGLIQSFSETESPFSTSGDAVTIPNRNVQTDQDIKVKLAWRTKGLFAHAIETDFKWKIEVLLERRGPGEFDLGATGVKTLTYGSGTYAGLGAGSTVTYPGADANSTTVVIPGGTIPDGLYDIVVVLRMFHEDGTTPCFLAAFADFGLVDFYREHA